MITNRVSQAMADMITARDAEIERLEHELILARIELEATREETAKLKRVIAGQAEGLACCDEALNSKRWEWMTRPNPIIDDMLKRDLS